MEKRNALSKVTKTAQLIGSLQAPRERLHYPPLKLTELVLKVLNMLCIRVWCTMRSFYDFYKALSVILPHLSPDTSNFFSFLFFIDNNKKYYSIIVHLWAKMINFDAVDFSASF